MAASEVDFVLVDNRQMLRDVSPLLEEGLAVIQQRGMSEDVCFGDMYVELVAGRLSCRLIRLDMQIVGYVITEVVAEHNGESLLSVPYLYVDCPARDLTPDVVEELALCAQEHGCAGVRFKTIRTGWERRLRGYGFEPTAIELTKTIGGTHGR